MLHNPHLGLTDTLQRLYEVAKLMADCVVPQEYGSTVEEKQSVGVKICHGLLEKLKYDFNVARSDNEVDMRYMINMEYAADLPINTMGRRIRTRLYFTSESHLHTVVNVLRFGFPDEATHETLLSPEGLQVLYDTPELCYLTHIVFRVFEDSRNEMANDSRRFRVEILFSPGAYHTPLHVNELDRDNDTSRLDTAPLVMISRDDLTCDEVEDFFDRGILQGQHQERKSYTTND
jgi:inositol-hexakisphosphate/diphosphoinositol-pentakisphosphate 1-kinase